MIRPHGSQNSLLIVSLLPIGYLTDDMGKCPAGKNHSIIEGADPLEFPLPTSFINDEIQPAFGVPFGLEPVKEMDAEHQPEEDEGKNDCLSAPKQIVIAPQKSEHQKHLKDLEPLGLQDVGPEEVEIVFEFREKFTHHIFFC